MQASAVSAQATDRELSRQLGSFVGFLMQTYGRDFIQLATEFDLSFSQMKALQLLFNVEQAESVKELGDHLGLSLAAMSRAADGLVQRGLVDRHEDARDRRIKRLSLTAPGRDLVQKMRESRMAGLTEFVSFLSPKEHALLAKALEPIMARAEIVNFCGGSAK
jgi:DNA-binding MarR family transcriptional regulator